MAAAGTTGMSASGSVNKVLSIEGIDVRFGGIHALRGVSFSVGNGELVGLIGPNGAGKTTMLKTILGQVKPSEGRVVLGGRDLRGDRSARRSRLGLAMSNQIVRPFRNLSVLDNVALAAGHALTVSPFAAIARVSREQQRDTAMKLLKQVGIESRAAQSPATQPLGVLKRLEVARALAIEPSVLMLDEPLAGLNHNEASRLAGTIKDLNSSGITIILIEHNLGEAQRISDRFVVLDNGTKIADGPVAEVMADEAVITAYLGEGWRHAKG